MFLIAALLIIGMYKSAAQDVKPLVEKLTTIDPEIKKYFPRWKICETDLQIQIYRTFVLLGYDKNLLNMQQIQILAAPLEDEYTPYDLLLITCGEGSMNSVEIEANMSGLAEYISGVRYYTGPYRGERADYPKRDYCFVDIKPEIPVTENEAAAIMNYLEPTNVTHAFTASLFEQTVKIGNTGFWLRAVTGTDEVGYPFWESGESKILLKRPLYANLNSVTMDRIPYLINAYMGGGYRITGGINDEGSILSWVPERKLNVGPGGKFIAGLDFHMPFHPEFGVHLNAEIPMKSMGDEQIKEGSYARFDSELGESPKFKPGDPRAIYDIIQTAPVLRSTGQASLFYHWWLDEANPENYIRLDMGLCYTEVREYAVYVDSAAKFHIAGNNIDGLKTYKPNEFGDWFYAKVEYRSQAAFPFGISFQYSNQVLLARVYVPLLGQWLYIEGKYSTPLRKVKPFEIENFFMISPVIRLTI